MIALFFEVVWVKQCIQNKVCTYQSCSETLLVLNNSSLCCLYLYSLSLVLYSNSGHLVNSCIMYSYFGALYSNSCQHLPGKFLLWLQTILCFKHLYLINLTKPQIWHKCTHTNIQNYEKKKSNLQLFLHNWHLGEQHEWVALKLKE